MTTTDDAHQLMSLVEQANEDINSLKEEIKSLQLQRDEAREKEDKTAQERNAFSNDAHNLRTQLHIEELENVKLKKLESVLKQIVGHVKPDSSWDAHMLLNLHNANLKIAEDALEAYAKS